jgi:exodeoxyribonuclease VII large subunit
VADYRAATPTAALVSLLPDRQAERMALAQHRRHLGQLLILRLRAARQQLDRDRQRLEALQPHQLLAGQRQWLKQQRALLQALSPRHLLERGFALIRDRQGNLVRSISSVADGDRITVDLVDGVLTAEVIQRLATPSAPAETAATGSA